MLIVGAILTLLYIAMILTLWIGLQRVPQPAAPGFESQLPNISIIIAARNEHANLDNLLTALMLQTYPDTHYEIIVVDDRSSDGTAESVLNWQLSLRNLRLVRVTSEQPDLVGKKNALTAGIKAARHDWLLFTDADCQPVDTWLETMAAHFTPNTDVVIGYSPFTISGKPSWLQRLRQVERLAMSAIYAAGTGWQRGIGATGRNLAYRKSLFERVGGFSGIGHLRSGDDDLFVQKITQPGKVRFAYVADPAAHVHTPSPKNWREMLNQETRRHSKITVYPLWILGSVAIAAFFYLWLIFVLVYGMISPLMWIGFVAAFFLKWVVDTIFIGHFARLTDEAHLIRSILLAEIAHLPMIFVLSLLGLFSSYQWKDDASKSNTNAT